jgi:hypothetical protein
MFRKDTKRTHHTDNSKFSNYICSSKNYLMDMLGGTPMLLIPGISTDTKPIMIKIMINKMTIFVIIYITQIRWNQIVQFY